MRGSALARSQKIVKVSDHLWAMPSAGNNAKYAVNLAASSCTCEAWGVQPPPRGRDIHEGRGLLHDL